MTAGKFIESLESISEEFVNESWSNKLIEEAELLISGFEEEISDLKDDLLRKKGKISDLNEEVESLVEQLEEAESISSFVIDDNHNNIRTVSCLESIFKNLDYIPIEELETIVKKYAVL